MVSGRVTPDSFLLDKASLAVVSREIFPKETEIVPAPSGESGTLQRPVSGARAATPALDNPELRRLGELCLAIEGRYGRPMDVEWAVANHTLYVLQARPITGLA